MRVPGIILRQQKIANKMLKQSIFTGIKWNTLALTSRASNQIFQLLLITHYLLPRDMGVLAIAFALFSFIQSFSDGGVSQAIFHYQQLCNEQLRQLYWFNLLIAALLAACLILLSPLAALLYQSPELSNLITILAVILIINASAQQLKILAQKNLNFSILAKIEIFSNTIGLLSTYIGLSLNIGIYSPIVGLLMIGICTSVFSWIFIKPEWRLRGQINFKSIQEPIYFGKNILINNLIDTLNSRLDVLLGGILLNHIGIGLYSLAKDINLRISSIINPIVTQTTLPVMAMLQSNPLALQSLYYRTLQLTSSISIPIYGIVFLHGHDIITLLFGENWLAMLPLLKILSSWGILNAIGNPIGNLLIAKGETLLAVKWNIGLAFFTIIMVAIGASFNVFQLALAITLLFSLSYIPSWYFLVKPLCGLSFMNFTKTLLTPLVLAIISGFISHILTFDIKVEIIHLTVGILIFGTTYIILSYRYNSYWLHIARDFIIHHKGKKICVA